MQSMEGNLRHCLKGISSGPYNNIEMIGIVTVLYNSEKVLEEFFLTLEKQTYRNFKLYIIDNASTDSGLKTAKDLSSKVSYQCEFFEEKTNWGVAKGNNIGIKAALKDGCDYILLSNNDVVLNYDDTLEILLQKIKKSGISIITPKIKRYQDSSIIWAAGGKFKYFGTKTKHIGANRKDSYQYNKEKMINYTPTCFVLIGKDVFSKIGYMDEEFFVYFDDTDFIRRAGVSGFKIMYTPSTSILHNESSSTGGMSYFKIYQLSKNQIIYTHKNFSKAVLTLLLARNWAIHYTYHKFKFNAQQYDAERKGLIDGWAHIKNRKI